MAIKTLHEIDEAEAATRERARQYQQLTEERDLLVRAVNKLEPQIVTAKRAIEALRKIQEISGSADLPQTLTTRSSLFVAGGYIVRDVLRTTADNAIKDQEIRLADLEDTLAKVHRRQVVCVERLKEFDE